MAKSDILARIRASKPASSSLPAPIRSTGPDSQIIERFMVNAELSGSSVHRAPSRAALDQITKPWREGAEVVLSCIPEISSSVDPSDRQDPLAYERVEVAFVEGELGVAENGAVWLTEAVLPHRILPFMCQHLVVILPVGLLVGDMHQAYQSVSIDRSGFGVFVAGPSKTADIEQTLVIGAQGARRHSVVLVG